MERKIGRNMQSEKTVVDIQNKTYTNGVFPLVFYKMKVELGQLETLGL